YQNEVVTVSGADVVTGWKLHSGRIYGAPMDWDLGMGNNQVFVDGQMMFQARFPHMGPANGLMNPALTDVAVTPDEVASSVFNQPDGYWAGCYVVGRANFSWAWQWAKITASSSNGILRVTPGSAPQMIPHIGNMTWFVGAGQVYLIGKLDLLGAPGEWDWEKNVLYLWAPAGDDPGSHLVEAKRRAWTVDFNGKDFIVVRGLRLVAGAVNMNGNHCALRDCDASYLSHFTLFPWSGYDGKGGAADGYQGIVVSGNDHVVRGCTIARTAGSGVVLTGARNLVSRCIIHDIDYSGTYSGPVLLAGRQNRVWSNTIHDAGRDIIGAGGADNDIRFNDLSRPGLLCKDLGVIYSGYIEAQGTRIAYNWVHDNPLADDGVGPGIYLDNYSRNFRVDHNVVWNCSGDAGIRINAPATNISVSHNTLFNCDDVSTHTYNCWPDNNPDPAFWTKDVYQIDAANNLYLGSEPGAQLVDYAHRDFRLVARAPAINAGVRIAGLTHGDKSSAPDLGAYEFGGAQWTAGADGCAPADLLPNCPADAPAAIDRQPVSDAQRAREIADLRFGMFVCWSLATVSGQEWTIEPHGPEFFAVTGCDTDQWCQVAKDAGMKYILFLTKHHDGFCLWDTQTTELKVTRSPLQTDVLAKLRASCEKYGLKLALYFSEGDWSWPGSQRGGQSAANPEVEKAQLQELLTQYGPVEFLWIDHAAGTGGLSHAELDQWVRKFQPNCFTGFNHGDAAGRISLRERGIPGPLGANGTTWSPEQGANEKKFGYVLAEFTYPINEKYWFYHLDEPDCPNHTPEELYASVVGAAQSGNIFSLDVGPDRAGQLRALDIATLKRVGQMLRREVPLPVSAGRPRNDCSGFWQNDMHYCALKAFDCDPGTRWMAPEGARSGWLEVDLGAPQTIARAVMNDGGYHRVQA
ncbi:MAG: alpha-L-fucosidase, partial [Opitutaceae bacterium]